MILKLPKVGHCDVLFAIAKQVLFFLLSALTSFTVPIIFLADNYILTSIVFCFLFELCVSSTQIDSELLKARNYICRYCCSLSYLEHYST